MKKYLFFFLLVSSSLSATQLKYQRVDDQKRETDGLELQERSRSDSDTPLVALDSESPSGGAIPPLPQRKKMDQLVIYIGSQRARQVMYDTFHAGGSEAFKRMIQAVDGQQEDTCFCFPCAKRKKISAKKVVENNKVYLDLYEKIEKEIAAKEGAIEKIQIPPDTLGILLFLSLKKSELDLREWDDIKKSDLVSWIQTKSEYDATAKSLESQNPEPDSPFYRASNGYGFSLSDLLENYGTRR